MLWPKGISGKVSKGIENELWSQVRSIAARSVYSFEENMRDFVFEVPVDDRDRGNVERGVCNH